MAEGFITFTFDDATRGVYEFSLSDLDDLDFPCVLYPRCDMLEQGNNSYFTWDEVVEVQDVYGWEIGSHTVNHLDLTQLDDTQLEYELTESKRLLEEKGARVYGLSVPLGRYDPRILRFASKHYLYCRNSDQGHNSLVDGYSDYHINMVTVRSTVPLDYYKAEIDKAVLDGTWLVLDFHRISSGQPVDPLELSADDLIELAAYVRSKDIDVVTIEDMMVLDEKSLVPNFSFESLDQDWARNWNRTGGTHAGSGSATVDENNLGNRRARRSLCIEAGSGNVTAVSDSVPVSHGESYEISFFIDQMEYTSGGSVFIIREESQSQGAKEWATVKIFDSAFVGSFHTIYNPTSPDVTDIQLIFGSRGGSSLKTCIDSVLMLKYDS